MIETIKDFESTEYKNNKENNEKNELNLSKIEENFNETSLKKINEITSFYKKLDFKFIENNIKQLIEKEIKEIETYYKNLIEQTFKPYKEELFSAFHPSEVDAPDVKGNVLKS
jgi:selenocysteine-specific translation elongation factor